MEHKEFDGQRLANDFLAGIDKRPIKGSHALATLGSATRLGGEIATASSSMHVTGHRIACVGDIVRYEDGTESRIISGAGAALTCKGHPMAIVGSTTDNGDTVTGSLQSVAHIREYADDAGIPGLLQAGYLAPTGDGA
ncbi:PAAR domain-containing protein [Herbaspirillum huttiense]|uniref:PAAR domain-containing protein n=1 Tax=Herbaspirillum huttiense TaxID=863372 RepID=UPI003B3AEA5D